MRRFLLRHGSKAMKMTRDLVHALGPITEKGFCVLRVIYNETLDLVAVVTAYFDDEVTLP